MAEMNGGHSHGRPVGQQLAQMDATRVREVDALVGHLLAEIEVPFTSLSKKVMGQVGDLKQVLAADYQSAPGLPDQPLLKELSAIVKTEILGRPEIWTGWDKDDPQCFASLVKIFGPREINVRTEPYRKGAGLALRGFFCRTNVGNSDRFVIFLNTAHIPAAVAATFGHELGHYLYGSLVGDDTPMTAFMEGTFANHLNEQHELFADALVSLASYSAEQIRLILGGDRLESGDPKHILKRVQKIYESIGPRIKLDLKKKKITSSWRVSYLTSMIHFFKLRCALLDSAGI
jgi:hypothetical protein